jgi:hypothetical protein
MMMDRIFQLFDNAHDTLKIFESFQGGTVSLPSGTHEIEVPTRKEPLEIWLSTNSGNQPVCHGNINKISYSITSRGFILYAEVNTDVLQINWSAIFALDDK